MTAFSHKKDMANVLKQRKALKLYYEKQGNGNNAIQNKNLINDLEKRIALENQKIGKRKSLRLKQLEELGMNMK